MKVTRTYQSKNKEIEIQVVSATNSIKVDPKRVMQISQEFLDYATQTPGLALIYDGPKKLLLLIEGDFDHIPSDTKSTN
jgi:hypothetical protein